MKFKLMFFAMLLSLALCAPAMAEVKSFDGFKVDVPAGWTSQAVPAPAKGAALMSSDMTTTITIAITPTSGMSVKAMAEAQAQAISGKVEEEDGGYHITGKVQGMDVSMYVIDMGDGNAASISVAGNVNHPDVEGILESIE